jgi:hypothetical protein
MANTNDFKYDATLLCRASFPSRLEDGDRPCIIEASIYRLNAAAVTSYMIDGSEPLLKFLGMNTTDTYITRHEIDDLFTVVHIDKEATLWQQ